MAWTGLEDVQKEAPLHNVTPGDEKDEEELHHLKQQLDGRQSTKKDKVS
jgi:hypothetical protein